MSEECSWAEMRLGKRQRKGRSAKRKTVIRVSGLRQTTANAWVRWEHAQHHTWFFWHDGIGCKTEGGVQSSVQTEGSRAFF